MIRLKNNSLGKTAAQFSAEYVDLDNNPFVRKLFRQNIRALKKPFSIKGFKHRTTAQKFIGKVWAQSSMSEEAIAHIYDIEYAGEQPSYRYINALMLAPQLFESITGISVTRLQKQKIIEIGAGSNEFLRFCHKECSVPKSNLYGCDVSTRSIAIIERDGFTAYSGRFEKTLAPKNFFDIVVLGYFIDYDTNQTATFEAAFEAVRAGGKIIIEGLFPVRPKICLTKDSSERILVTRGKSIVEDVSLVCQFFEKHREAGKKRMRVERIVLAHRYIGHSFGFDKRNSIFIVLKAE